jgi:hypothetical protein
MTPKRPNQEEPFGVASAGPAKTPRTSAAYPERRGNLDEKRLLGRLIWIITPSLEMPGNAIS